MRRAVAALDALVYSSSTAPAAAHQDGGAGGDAPSGAGSADSLGYLSSDPGSATEVRCCVVKHDVSLYRADTWRVCGMRRHKHTACCLPTAWPTSAACGPSARASGQVGRPVATRWRPPDTGGRPWAASRTYWPARCPAATPAPRCCCRRRWNPALLRRCVPSSDTRSQHNTPRETDSAVLLATRRLLRLCRSCRARTGSSARGRCATASPEPSIERRLTLLLCTDECYAGARCFIPGAAAHRAGRRLHLPGGRPYPQPGPPAGGHSCS